MTEEVKKLIEKAERALEVATELLRSGYPSVLSEAVSDCLPATSIRRGNRRTDNIIEIIKIPQAREK